MYMNLIDYTLKLGYNYYQSMTGAAPTPDTMALIVGKGEVEGIQWDELKTCGLYLVSVALKPKENKLSTFYL